MQQTQLEIRKQKGMEIAKTCRTTKTEKGRSTFSKTSASEISVQIIIPWKEYL